MSTADLVATAVSKRFAGTQAVDALSFSVERGSFFSILGPSGCGKTTLLRMIAGFIESDSGDIAIGGNSMRGVSPNRRPVNMVFQQLALFPMMSVGENVAFGLAQRGMPRAERMRRSHAMLERVGLSGAAGRRVEELSGGQRQRVAIARSLVLEPTLLLLDEPLGALDLKLREHMKIELKQLQAAFGTTFVYITHDQSEALVLSDHVGVMNHGRFEQLGTPQDLYYRPQTPFVAAFVGANNRIVGAAHIVSPATPVLDGAGDRMGDGDGAVVEITTADGWTISARGHGRIAAGDAVEAFVRPEAASLARHAQGLPAGQPHHAGLVQSLLFDGANSAVLIQEIRTRREFRIALPQTGQFSDLRPGEPVLFSFDPDRAVCFPARSGAAGRDG
ncbi:MAG: ABC transporter ATP-binding protein [Pseudomonadota bacterium]|nr:ABC transporter ATP-binding protein [Pseudomonadota bacterium]